MMIYFQIIWVTNYWFTYVIRTEWLINPKYHVLRTKCKAMYKNIPLWSCHIIHKLSKKWEFELCQDINALRLTMINYYLKSKKNLCQKILWLIRNKNETVLIFPGTKNDYLQHLTVRKFTDLEKNVVKRRNENSLLAHQLTYDVLVIKDVPLSQRRKLQIL